MRRGLIVVAALLLLGAAPAWAAQPTTDELYTAGLTNGRMWNIFDLTSKVVMLRALHEGIGNAKALVGAHENVSQEDRNSIMGDIEATCIPEGTSVGDLVSEVDSFYADRANARVPIIYAFNLLVMKIRGADEHTLSNLKMQYRKAVQAF